MTAGNFDTLLSNGIGAIVLLLPNKNTSSLEGEDRESILQLEEHLLALEIEIPVYFAEETQDISELLDDLNISFDGSGKGQKTSAAQSKKYLLFLKTVATKTLLLGVLHIN